MASLILNHPSLGTVELSLKSGANSVGRVEQNDLQISDGSVSSHHCEITLEGETVWVRDLGSTNGTFIDDQPVTKSILCAGQSLRLGSVNLSLVPASVESSGTDESAPAAPPSKSRLRVNRASSEETSTSGTDSTPAGNSTSYQTETRHAPKVSMPPPVVPRKSFYEQLGGAFGYPLKQEGVIILICGTIVFTAMSWAQLIIGGLLFIGISVTSVGYTFAFMQNIISSTVNGDDQMPGWPDVSDFLDDIVYPCFRLLGVWVAYLLPGLLALYFDLTVPGIALLVLGAICIPMALLTVAIADNLGGVNPVVVLGSIAKIPGQYAATCSMFLVVLILTGGCSWLLDLVHLPIISSIVSSFIGLYGLTVQMRVLGLLYRCNQKKLRWFD